MKLFHKNSIPQPDIETARKILNHAFELNHQEPNSIPFEELASYSNYRRERYSLQRTVIIIMMVFFILLPLLFIPPTFTLTAEKENNGWNPTYQLVLDTFMLVEKLNVQIDGRNIPVYEVDSHVYSIEPMKNGQMDITVTLLNKQVLTQSVFISNVDREAPSIDDYWVEDGLLYISISDAGSGVCFEKISATNVDGEEVLPVRIEKEEGYIIFEDPHNLLEISIPDNMDNVLQVVIAVTK